MYVRLEDSANAFTAKFVDALDRMTLDLRARVKQYMKEYSEAKYEELMENEDEASERELSVDGVFIYQIDYT